MLLVCHFPQGRVRNNIIGEVQDRRTLCFLAGEEVRSRFTLLHVLASR